MSKCKVPWRISPTASNCAVISQKIIYYYYYHYFFSCSFPRPVFFLFFPFCMFPFIPFICLRCIFIYLSDVSFSQDFDRASHYYVDGLPGEILLWARLHRSGDWNVRIYQSCVQNHGSRIWCCIFFSLFWIIFFYFEFYFCFFLRARARRLAIEMCGYIIIYAFFLTFIYLFLSISI